MDCIAVRCRVRQCRCSGLIRRRWRLSVKRAATAMSGSRPWMNMGDMVTCVPAAASETCQLSAANSVPHVCGPFPCRLRTRATGRAPCGTVGPCAAAASARAGVPAGQRRPDLGPFLRCHARPAADLVDRPAAADAKPGLRVNDTDLDAGAVDLVALPDLIGHRHSRGPARPNDSAPLAG